MAVVTRELSVESRGENEVIDVTEGVQRRVSDPGLQNGIVTVFVSGSTAAVTTIEFEPGLARDFTAMLDRTAPRDIAYEHRKAWKDDNGRSHVKASLLGPSLSVPFVKGRLALGTWQQIVMIELDVRPRTRSIVLQIMGE